jgi:hypothetical protein
VTALWPEADRYRSLFVLPVIAQQKDTITDSKIVQQSHAVAGKSDEIFKKGDAAARAAVFMEDAVLVTERGTFYGRPAIEKYYVDTFQKWHFLNSNTTYAPGSPHALGADGNAVPSEGANRLSVLERMELVAEMSGGRLRLHPNVKNLLRGKKLSSIRGRISNVEPSPEDVDSNSALSDDAGPTGKRVDKIERLKQGNKRQKNV